MAFKFDISDTKRDIFEALRRQFKPEFLNRIDDVIVFETLKLEDIIKIVELQMKLVEKRLEEKKITLELTTKAKEFIAKESYTEIDL